MKIEGLDIFNKTYLFEISFDLKRVTRVSLDLDMNLITLKNKLLIILSIVIFLNNDGRRKMFYKLVTPFYNSFGRFKN